MVSLDTKLKSPYKALKHLADHGWIPLGRGGLSTLLNVSSQAIYQRSSKIDTIKVGATRRVYEEEVLNQLDKSRTSSEHKRVILDLYETIKREQTKQEQS